MAAGLFPVVALALAFAGAIVPAHASEADACAAFKWPLERERQLFAAGPRQVAAQGAFPVAAGAARVELKPVEGLPFVAGPERKPAAGSFGAVLPLDAMPGAGLYQITLSAEAWLDVVQDGKLVRSGAFSGKEGCPSLRKSVRFTLTAAPTLIQISNAKAASIDIAVLSAP